MTKQAVIDGLLSMADRQFSHEPWFDSEDADLVREAARLIQGGADEPDCSVPDCITTQIPVHADPTGQTREPPHCPTCDCGSERSQCQHDLTKPDTTLIVIGPYDARCPVCNCEWHIPNPTHVSRSGNEA